LSIRSSPLIWVAASSQFELNRNELILGLVLENSMKLLHSKFDKRLPIYAVLYFFGFTALFCFVQSEPVDFEDAEVTLLKLEFSGFTSPTFASLSSSTSILYFHSLPYKSLVLIHHLHRESSLIPGLDDVSLLGRSLGGCGS